MHDHERNLIAVLLGDAKASARLQRWLTTPAGRQARAGYRKTLAQLERGLSDRAVQHLPTPVYYSTIDSPVGQILVAASTAGVARLAFGGSQSAFVRDIERQLHAEVVRSSERLAGILTQLDAYFAGKSRSFDVAVDPRLMTPFQKRVLDATKKVPAGSVASYSEIAAAIGQPAARRAVGQALGRNPVPIVIPCHRIVASDGSLGGYVGGATVKKKLLALEANGE